MTTYNKEQVEELLVEYIRKNLDNLSLMSLEEHEKSIVQYVEKIYSRKRCKGMTEKNKQCKNNAQPGKEYCKRHDQNIIIKELPKMSMNTCHHVFTRGKKKGHSCNKKTREGSDYCSAHLRFTKETDKEGGIKEVVETEDVGSNVEEENSEEVQVSDKEMQTDDELDI